MARVPIEDLIQLWEETPERNWDSLYQTLLTHIDEDEEEGMEDEMINQMLTVVGDLEEEEVPYPNSVEELLELINQRLAEVI